MSKIAAVLEEETTRLARKEVNTQTGRLCKATAQNRRGIAQPKRHAVALSSQVTFLEQQEKKRARKREAHKRLQLLRV